MTNSTIKDIIEEQVRNSCECMQDHDALWNEFESWLSQKLSEVERKTREEVLDILNTEDFSPFNEEVLPILEKLEEYLNSKTTKQ